jgi:hypothetical protein
MARASRQTLARLPRTFILSSLRIYPNAIHLTAPRASSGGSRASVARGLLGVGDDKHLYRPSFGDKLQA